MSDKKEEKKSYIKEVMGFYLAPELRSLATLSCLIVFGYCAIYYFDNVTLAIKFLWYILTGPTALTGIAYLFTGLAFVVSLLLPFCTSLYAIFVVHEIWQKKEWANHLKWVITGIVVVGALFVVLLTDDASRIAARQPSLQSFIEDQNLTGKI